MSSGSGEVTEKAQGAGGAGYVARFTQGSIMRHVVRMTLTSGFGLTFMFLVDFITLFWIARLQKTELLSALGFAGAIQFFTISVAVGLMIGGVALVSRALGRKDVEGARKQASAALTVVLSLTVLITIILLLNLDNLIGLLNAKGDTAAIAKRFLMITIPSLPLMATGMVTSALLRAEGDGFRSMMVTLTSGLIALCLDPILIIAMGFGMDGAAVVMVLARTGSALVGLYFLGVTYKLLGRFGVADLKRFLPPFLAISIPALLTQISPTFANFILTRYAAEFGDSVVAGFSVIFRLTVLAFGGIFALSGAIGGIIGQNYGASLFPRVRETYVKSLYFGTIYTFGAWALLLLMRPFLQDIFHLDDVATKLVNLFIYTAVYFIFVSAIFVSNAVFNNLGRPLWSTGINWVRDLILMAPAAHFFAQYWNEEGLILAQVALGVLMGVVAMLLAKRRLDQIDPALHHELDEVKIG